MRASVLILIVFCIAFIYATESTELEESRQSDENEHIDDNESEEYESEDEIGNRHITDHIAPSECPAGKIWRRGKCRQTV